MPLRNCASRIIPAILPQSATHLSQCAEQLTFAPTLQIDIVDGVFAAPATWPYDPAGTPVEARAVCERYEVQVDIMAVDPLAMAQKWIESGARELVIHIETVADLDPFKALRQAHSVRLWLSGADTMPVHSYVAHAADIDGVQLMGIETIGRQGQPLSSRVIDNIKALRAQVPTLPIQIDGSVNAETIDELKAAGATDFVVGSAIVGSPDPRAAYTMLSRRVVT